MHPINRQEELVESAAWVVRAKVVLCGSLLVIFAMANFAGFLTFPLLAFSIAPLLEITLNVPHQAFLRRAKRPQDVFIITSTVDVLLITWAAYTLGDLGKFLALIIYPLVIVFAGVVMEPQYPYFYANLCCLCLSALTWLEYYHLLPPVQPLMMDLSGIGRFAILSLIWPLYNFLAYFVRYLASLLRKRERQLLDSAFRDELTGLPSRDLFMERLRQAMARAEGARVGGRTSFSFAVLFLDLDRFKIINTSLGHRLGDQLLIEAARRLEASVKPVDTVARLSGDEYVILLEDYHDEHAPIRIAERIQEVLTLPFSLDGHEAFTSASIGIAFGAAGYRVPEEMIRDAHTAMYRAKSAGKACHTVFEAQMRPRAVARMELETDLRHAVERQELCLYYQPIRALSGASETLIGFEALVRWQHPTRGLIMPNEFIPLAEEVGLILPLGSWVMREAGRTLRRWHEQYPVHAALTVSVNLSGEQLKHAHILEHVTHMLSTTGVRAKTLKFEITESVLIEHAEAILDQIAHIQELGIAFYLDDFGTGYSSLSYLRRFNVEKLKIDRSFISRLERSPKDLSMVRNMIRLAHGLDMQVIAEGVETPAQLEHLRHIRCDFVQGYYLSKPLPAQDAEALLAHS